MRSIEFWVKRYNNNDTSGNGSVNKLGTFKVNLINDFIKKNGIESVCDFGFGDTQIGSKIIVDSYTGFDITDKFLDKSDIFVANNVKLINRSFDKINYTNEFDVVMCLDVLYHILEDEQEYMRVALDNMITASKKYLIIYAQNSYNTQFDDEYKLHMFNSKWKQHLASKPLELLYEQDEPVDGCSAQFYIYEKL